MAWCLLCEYIRMSGNSIWWIGFKWFIVPITLAFAGYYFIGPRIGDVPELESSAVKVKGLIDETVGQNEPVKEEPSESKIKLDIKVEQDKDGSDEESSR